MSSSPFLPGTERQVLMDKGITQLESWLFDVIRIGLLQYDFGEDSIFEISSRMVDAKLGGIARRLRRIPILNRSDPDWVEQLLQILTELYLLVTAFRNKETVPPATLISAYTVAGFNFPKTQLLNLNPIADQWLICGLDYEQEENLRSRYTWLMGVNSKRTALLLDFAFGRTEFEVKYNFKQSYQGKLYFYPGSFPLRAYLQDPISIRKIPAFPAAFDSIDKFLDVYASALGKNPWIGIFPSCLKEVSLRRSANHFVIYDREGQTLVVKNPDEQLWPLYASLALQSCTIFGLWNGKSISLSSIHDAINHIPV